MYPSLLCVMCFCLSHAEQCHATWEMQQCHLWHCDVGLMGYDCLQGLAMLPELTNLQQRSVPASAASTFPAAASSPTALRGQVRHIVNI